MPPPAGGQVYALPLEFRLQRWACWSMPTLENTLREILGEDTDRGLSFGRPSSGTEASSHGYLATRRMVEAYRMDPVIAEQLGRTHPPARHLDDFLTDLANAGASAHTRRAYRGDLIAFAAHHGEEIAELTAAPVRALAGEPEGEPTPPDQERPLSTA